MELIPVAISDEFPNSIKVVGVHTEVKVTPRSGKENTKPYWRPNFSTE